MKFARTQLAESIPNEWQILKEKSLVESFDFGLFYPSVLNSENSCLGSDVLTPNEDGARSIFSLQHGYSIMFRQAEGKR